MTSVMELYMLYIYKQTKFESFIKQKATSLIGRQFRIHSTSQNFCIRVAYSYPSLWRLQMVPMHLWQSGSSCTKTGWHRSLPWWRHQMETFSVLLAFCAGNSPVTGEFPSQMPVTRSFDVFFDLCSNNRLSKQLWGWWFETPSRSLWRHFNGDPACSTNAL